MKINMNFECTPEEARRFIGLPDLSPLHASYIDRMRIAVEQGVTPEGLKPLFEAWGPMGEAGVALWTAMIAQMSNGTKA